MHSLPAIVPIFIATMAYLFVQIDRASEPCPLNAQTSTHICDLEFGAKSAFTRLWPTDCPRIELLHMWTIEWLGMAVYRLLEYLSVFVSHNRAVVSWVVSTELGQERDVYMCIAGC